MTIGIIVAMDKEKELIVDHMENRKEFELNKQLFVDGTIGKQHIVLLQCGIGKVAAAVGAVELIRQYHPDRIINSGVAGALDSSIGVMDVVVGERVVYHDVDCFTDNPHGQIQGFPLYYEADKKVLDVIRGVISSRRVHYGLICSGDRFVSNLDDLRTIKDYFPEGLAVDMESCAIAQVCYMYNVPFVSMRIVSDTPGVNDHEKQYYNFWKEAPETSFAILKTIIEAF